MRKGTKLVAASAGLAMSLSLAACGDDGGSGSATGDRLDGVSLTVGSKDFTENILLGEILAQALANEGADVTNQTNLGGTSVAREALLAGELNVYPEYNGTGWTVHLGNEDPSQDPEELYTVTAEADLEQNDIKWVGRSPFNDTYGFAANGDLAAAEGGFDFDSMAAYPRPTPTRPSAWSRSSPTVPTAWSCSRRPPATPCRRASSRSSTPV